jgi:hypothetical protein
MSRLVLVLTFAAAASTVHAEPKPAPLRLLPTDKLKGMAPLLRANDVALIEEGDQGALKQLTTVTLAAAPPEQVREVVAHPERYAEFVRNTKENTILERGADGSVVHQYAISYKIYTVDGRHRYVFEKESQGDGAPAVRMYDADDNGTRHYRWEFLPAPGGGTIVVLYGYSLVPKAGLMERFLDRAPTLEFGLALIPQMTLMLAMTKRAEELAHKAGLKPALAAQPRAGGGYEFMLARGTVALFRTDDKGRISDISLVDRSSAKPEIALRVAADPTQWASFVPTISKSLNLGNKDGMAAVQIEQSLPLVSWSTAFAYRVVGSAVQYLGLGGDLRGGQYQVDVRPLGDKTEIVLRANHRFDANSLIVRQLYKLEPLFEYGIDVGLNLLVLQGIRRHAEQLTRSMAGR